MDLATLTEEGEAAILDGNPINGGTDGLIYAISDEVVLKVVSFNLFSHLAGAYANTISEDLTPCHFR